MPKEPEFERILLASLLNGSSLLGGALSKNELQGFTMSVSCSTLSTIMFSPLFMQGPAEFARDTFQITPSMLTSPSGYKVSLHTTPLAPTRDSAPVTGFFLITVEE
jgi:hypothetical protein